MKTLIIINDLPYDTERLYNALREVGACARQVGDHGASLRLDDHAEARTR